MRIAVIGSGYVGLVSAACFAEIGHDVISVDNDGAKIAALERGEVPIHERFVPELLSCHRGGRLRLSTSDPLRQRLKQRGIELIAPYRKNNQGRRNEDGRKLRRYKRRWIVERTNAWLGQFRRLLVRHEHLPSTYRAFFYLACFWITLRHCL